MRRSRTCLASRPERSCRVSPEVAAHVGACGLCRSRVVAERAVRHLIDARKASLRAVAAPDALHARCARLAETHGAAAALRTTVSGWQDWRARLAPLAVAAALVL